MCLCSHRSVSLFSWILAVNALALAGTKTTATGRDVLAPAPANTRWHLSSKNGTATFLGKEEKETAVIVLRKAAVLDSEIIVDSDASAIDLISGDSARISFPLSSGPDGITTKFKLGGGDEPTLLENEKENPHFSGKWIEEVSSKDPNLTIEMKGATFAKVTFEASAMARDKPVGAFVPGAPAAEADDAKGLKSASRGDNAPELLQTVAPQQLRAASMRFAAGVSRNCPHCMGKGTVVVSEDAGTRRDGVLTRKLSRDVTETCQVCNGKGKVRATDEALNRLSATFVTSLAHLKRDDPKSQEAISDAYKMITDNMIGDYKTWTLLTENGRSVLSQKSPTAGTPVVAKAIVKAVLPPEGDKRRYIVEIGGTDKRVQIKDPVSADEVKTGPVIVGGLVSTVSKDDSISVLSHGFMIAPPIEDGWWWWYWWRPSYHPLGE